MIEQKIAFDEATKPQLIMYAAQAIGLSVSPQIGEDKLREKIRETFSGDTITLFVEDEPGSVGEPAQRADAAAVAASYAATATAAPPPTPPPVTHVAPALTVNEKALVGSSAKNDPVVELTIYEQEGAGGKRPVFTSVNGVGFLIPRGEAVPVPYRYYEVLDNASKSTYEQNDAGDIIESVMKSYPFSVNVMPPQAEIDAYFAAQQTAAA